MVHDHHAELASKKNEDTVPIEIRIKKSQRPTLSLPKFHTKNLPTAMPRRPHRSVLERLVDRRARPVCYRCGDPLLSAVPPKPSGPTAPSATTTSSVDSGASQPASAAAAAVAALQAEDAQDYVRRRIKDFQEATTIPAAGGRSSSLVTASGGGATADSHGHTAAADSSAVAAMTTRTSASFAAPPGMTIIDLPPEHVVTLTDAKSRHQCHMCGEVFCRKCWGHQWIALQPPLAPRGDAMLHPQCETCKLLTTLFPLFLSRLRNGGLLTSQAHCGAIVESETLSKPGGHPPSGTMMSPGGGPPPSATQAPGSILPSSSAAVAPSGRSIDMPLSGGPSSTNFFSSGSTGEGRDCVIPLTPELRRQAYAARENHKILIDPALCCPAGASSAASGRSGKEPTHFDGQTEKGSSSGDVGLSSDHVRAVRGAADMDTPSRRMLSDGGAVSGTASNATGNPIANLIKRVFNLSERRYDPQRTVPVYLTAALPLCRDTTLCIGGGPLERPFANDTSSKQTWLAQRRFKVPLFAIQSVTVTAPQSAEVRITLVDGRSIDFVLGHYEAPLSSNTDDYGFEVLSDDEEADFDNDDGDDLNDRGGWGGASAAPLPGAPSAPSAAWEGGDRDGGGHPPRSTTGTGRSSARTGGGRLGAGGGSAGRMAGAAGDDDDDGDGSSRGEQTPVPPEDDATGLEPESAPGTEQGTKPGSGPSRLGTATTTATTTAGATENPTARNYATTFTCFPGAAIHFAESMTRLLRETTRHLQFAAHHTIVHADVYQGVTAIGSSSSGGASQAGGGRRGPGPRR